MTASAGDFVQQNFAAFQERGFEALAELLHEDCVWHACGRRAGEPLRGLKDITDWYTAKHQATAESTITLHDTLISDDHVVTLYEENVTRNGESATFQGVYVMHMADDKITEVWNIPVDQYAYDEFYAAESGA